MTSKLSEYYDATAALYDDLHSTQTNPEHTRAMELGWPFFETASSVLDVGSGTGRSLIWLHNQNKSLRLFGIEPSQGMTDIAKRNLPDPAFRPGTAQPIPYKRAPRHILFATR